MLFSPRGSFRSFLTFALIGLVFLARATAEPKDKPLPFGAIARLGSLDLRHVSEVVAVAFSPDGKLIASASNDNNQVKIWSRETGKLVNEIIANRIFEGGTWRNDCCRMAFTADGSMIAAGAVGDVCFWDVASGRLVKKIRIGGEAIYALTLSTDKKSFYCGGTDGKFYHFEIATEKLLAVHDYFQGSPPQILRDKTPSRKAILNAVSEDGSTAVWLVEDWQAEKDHFSLVALHAVVWDINNLKERFRFNDFSDKEFVISPDNKFVSAYSKNRRLIVRNAHTGEKLKNIGDDQQVDTVMFSPDSRFVAALITDRVEEIKWFELATEKQVFVKKIGVRSWRSSRDCKMAISQDGRSLALAIWKNVRVWDIESGTEKPLPNGHRLPVRELTFSAKGNEIIAVDDESVQHWRADNFSNICHPLHVYDGDNRSIAESLATNLRIFQPKGKPIQFRELTTNKLVYQFEDLPGTFYNGRFSDDSSTFAVARRDRDEMVVVDVRKRKIRAIAKGYKFDQLDFFMSPDGKLLAFISLERKICILDTHTGKINDNLKAVASKADPKDKILQFQGGSFSADNQKICFSTQFVYPPNSGLNMWRSDLNAESRIRIRVWDIQSGRELRQFESCQGQFFVADGTAIRFSPDSRCLAIPMNLSQNPSYQLSRTQPEVSLVEVASGGLRRIFKGHTDFVLAMAFSPDGNILATSGKDASVYLWDLHHRSLPEIQLDTPSKQLDSCWIKITADNASEAYDAMLNLAKYSNKNVPFLASKLKPVPRHTKQQVAQLINGLDHPSYAIREDSTAKLAAMHDAIRSDLASKLNERVSAETADRLRKLITFIDSGKFPKQTINQLRALEVLEMIATPNSISIIDSLAKGDPEAKLTIEAKKAHTRLLLISKN